MKWDHPLINLLVSVVVMMLLFSGVKLAINKVTDDGIIGDIKKLLILA